MGDVTTARLCPGGFFCAWQTPVPIHHLTGVVRNGSVGPSIILPVEHCLSDPSDPDYPEPDAPPPAEPIFNLPRIVSALALVLVSIHAVRTLFLSTATDNELILLFAFIPAIYGPAGAAAPIPEAAYWMPFSYGLLHGSWLHLGVNVVWMLAFGTPVARRFGAVRFLALTLFATACGALAHYLANPGAFVPMIGASAAVSGHMGAAMRFVFNPLSRNGAGRGFRHDGPALSLAESFTNRQFVIFFIVWMGMNLAFGVGAASVPGAGSAIAWQAHIGGFAAGIFGFFLFERRNTTLSA